MSKIEGQPIHALPMPPYGAAASSQPPMIDETLSGTQLDTAINAVRTVMENLPPEFVRTDLCPMDHLMHVLGVLQALRASFPQKEEYVPLIDGMSDEEFARDRSTENPNVGQIDDEAVEALMRERTSLIETKREQIERLKSKADTCYELMRVDLKAREAAERENKALRDALERQRTNIEHWLETGESASPEESKSIYDQICAALVKP